ncbi:hypothetical protein [Nocardia fluminea]|uniref:hypothetical protein n=1 Tax=Nocardia fluminea TaxID=134984 RepID=UPI0033C2AB80
MSTPDPFENVLSGADSDRHAAARRVIDLLADGRDHPAAEVIAVTGLPVPTAIDLLDAGASRRPPVWRRQGERDPESGSWVWTYVLPVRSRAPETVPPTPEVANGEKSAQNGDEGVIRPIETQPVGGLTHKPAYPAVRVREVPPNPNAPKKRMRRTWRESRLAWSALSQAKQRAKETYGTDTPTT